MYKTFSISICALCLILAAVPIQSVGQCSAPWVPFHTSCYIFATGYPEDWTEAGSFCSRLGAKLAEIETSQENNFVRHHANNSHPGGNFWVGGTDVLVDGQWIWISTQEKMHFTDWLPGEPNGGTHEGCLVLYGGRFNLHWNDYDCHSQHFFVCEKSMSFDGNPDVVG